MLRVRAGRLVIGGLLAGRPSLQVLFTRKFTEMSSGSKGEEAGAAPAAGAEAAEGGNQKVEWATFEEGKAKILHRPGEAFYNPAQVQNRDLSVAVLREFGMMLQREKEERVASGKAKANDPHASSHNGLKILEGLSATGLRAVRYAKEIECVDRVIANDFSAAAVESIQRNIEYNGVQDKVEASHGDAAMVMYQNRDISARYTVVDLDPYGSATPFLDAAVQATADGGLMAVTCTDLAVLCGAHSEACYAKYGSMSLRGKHCHEQALRIVLSSIETAANRYKRHIVPLLSVHMDFYVRMFVRVYTSAAQVPPSHCKPPPLLTSPPPSTCPLPSLATAASLHPLHVYRLGP